MSEIIGGGISLSDFDEEFKNLIIPHGLAVSHKHPQKNGYDVCNKDEMIHVSLYDKLLKMVSYEEPKEDIENENENEKEKEKEIEKKKELEKSKRELTLQPVSSEFNKKKTKSKNIKIKQKQTRRKRS
jgi:hypothetical protein